MGALKSVSLSFKAGNSHVRFLRVVVKVETERLVVKIGLHEPGWQVINRNGVVGKAKNTIHGGKEESWSGSLVDLTEGHLSFNITKSGNILGSDTLNSA